MKFLKQAIVLDALGALAMAAKADCPFAPTCPLDGAQLRIGTEYSGIKAIGITRTILRPAALMLSGFPATKFRN